MPYVNKVTVGGVTQLDLSGDTITADKLSQGYTAHDASGAPIVGTNTGGGGGGGTYTIYTSDTAPSSAQTGDIWVDYSGDIPTPVSITPLSVTANGTYTAPSGSAYSPVTVNVPTSGKAAQISNASGRRQGTSYAEIEGISLTVSKSGTYDVYWTGYRSSTSGTFGTQLYRNNSSSGSQQTSFSNNEQHPHLSDVSLSAGDELTIRGRSGSTNNYIYASNLVIIEA